MAHSYLYLQDTNKKVIQITGNIPTKGYKKVKLEKYRTVVTTLVQYFWPFIDFYDFSNKLYEKFELVLFYMLCDMRSKQTRH